MKKHLNGILFVSMSLLLGACGGQQASPSSGAAPQSTPESSSEISTPEDIDDGRELIENQLYTDNGLKVYFNARGARIEKITWGEDNKEIAKDGFTVGRVANRIAAGKFTLNEQEYNVTINNNGNSLHGGSRQWNGPFANATWEKVDQTPSTITYSIHSEDGEEGYPGSMDMSVTYTLRQSGELSIEYSAVSDADTLCNPTNHLYISVNGNTSYNDVKLWIDADEYTPLNNNQLPTGETAPVADTKFDYSTERAFSGSDSYDDNYVLNGEGYRKVATLTGESLGVKVDVFTDRPGLQLYKAGNGQICLESQMMPDAINHPEFDEYGTTILREGEEFYSKTAYVFSAVE